MNVEVNATEHQRTLEARRGVLMTLLSLQDYGKIKVRLWRIRSGVDSAAHPVLCFLELAQTERAPAGQQIELETPEPQLVGLQADGASLPTAPCIEQRRSLREKERTITRVVRQPSWRRIQRRGVAAHRPGYLTASRVMISLVARSMNAVL